MPVSEQYASWTYAVVVHFPKLTVVSFTNTYNQRLGVIDKIGRPRSGSPICLSRVWLLTELGDKKSFHHKNWDVPLPFSDYIYKLKNQRGHIDSLWLWVSRLSARQTELFFRQKILSADERLGAKLRVTENRCVLFDSLTNINSALLPQHWALYPKVDSTPIYIYIHI